MNILSFDLESWTHKYFLDCDSKTRNRKDGGYICDAVLEVLGILDRHGVKATFFVVSEIYNWHPWLVHKIRDGGHEIGFHTHNHRLLHSRKILMEELDQGKEFIEAFDPKGFRAPQAFIRKEHLPILREWGFMYDSSIYKEFNLFVPIEGFLEVPISTYPLVKSDSPLTFPRELTVGLMMREIPFGSGYFFGILGSRTGWFIRQVNKRDIPASLIVHPWQIRNIPPLKGRIKGTIPRRVKMIPYEINRKMSLDLLLQDHEFTTITRVINTYDYDKKNFHWGSGEEIGIEEEKPSGNGPDL